MVITLSLMARSLPVTVLVFSARMESESSKAAQMMAIPILRAMSISRHYFDTIWNPEFGIRNPQPGNPFFPGYVY
jgi:hypothetical protein